MIAVVKRTYPDAVFATHADRQLDEIRDLYPNADFELWSTEEDCQPRGPLPTVYTVVEREASA